MACGSREPREGTLGTTSVIIAAITAVLIVAVTAGIVHDMGTLGSLFSILALPIALAIFYIAQKLHLRARRSREAVLRDRDARNMDQLFATIDLCRTLVQGTMRSGTQSSAPDSMTTMRHITENIGIVRAQHGNLLSHDGSFVAERIRDTALAAIIAGNSCTKATLLYMDRSLVQLEDAMLRLDDPQLVGLRRREADAGSHMPE